MTATDVATPGTDPVPYVEDGRDVAITDGPAVGRLEGTLAT